MVINVSVWPGGRLINLFVVLRVVVMSGESNYARTLVEEAFNEARARAEMDVDATGRAIIQAVIEQYQQYRDLADIGRELDYLRDSLDEEDLVVTRGC